MESLYRKYRPLTFESVVGQQHIVSTLEHAVAEGRLSHAYLFCGPRGTGKTTMARILAKALLCQGAEAARATGASGCMPDGCCPECEAIAAGTHPDVYELDAASRTGVDNVREEIVNSVNFAPVRGAYKVYIIDEVHMLTTAAFNALLKTLEEPPSHVVFVLCTTDPQKILETILSRCQRFDFHRISNAEIVERLRFICEQEGFAFDEAALEIVAKHARGGMRDALSTLEQLSVFGGGSVRIADAQTLLGEVASTVLSEFACKIAVRDTVGLFGLVRAQVDEGNDLLELARDLVAHMRDVYTAAIAGPRVELFDGTPDEVSALVEEASAFEGADRLARTLTVLDDAVLEMRNASDPRLVLEIALTRLSRPETDLTLEALAERIAHLETQLAAGIQRGPMTPEQRAAVAPAKPAVGVGPKPSAAPASVARPAVPAPAAPAATAVPKPASQTAPVSAQAKPAAPAASAPATVSRPAPSAPVPASAATPSPAQARPTAPAPAAQVSATVPAEAQPDMAACAITPPAADAGDLQRRWLEAVKHITAAQPSRGGLLQSSRAVSDDGETLTVAFPKGSDFAMRMITRPDSHAVVMPVVCQMFGKRNVKYIMEGDAAKQGAPAVQPQAPAPQVAASAPRAATSVPVQPASQPAPQVPAAAPIVQPAAQPEPVSQAAHAAAPQAYQPVTPAVDQASGPTVLPEPDIEADRRAWEDEQVPYDDDAIAAYTDDEEIPPFEAPVPQPDVPVAPARPSTPQPAPAPADPGSAVPAAPAPVSAPAAVTTQDETTPQTTEEAQALLQSVWGNVTFKPVE